MQFRLLYMGELLGASKTNTRAAHKHEVRCELSPQLKRLWESEKNLRQYCRTVSNFWVEKHGSWESFTGLNDDESRSLREEYGINHLAKNYERSGQGLIPLVTSDMGLRCKLDVLFLRPEEPGHIIRSGDIDNRIKTLFDALRIPKDADERGGIAPREEPIYCLLEDDRLISEIRIVTDQLLMLPHAQAVKVNDCFLVIDVQLEAPKNSQWVFVF